MKTVLENKFPCCEFIVRTRTEDELSIYAAANVQLQVLLNYKFLDHFIQVHTKILWVLP